MSLISCRKKMPKILTHMFYLSLYLIWFLYLDCHRFNLLFFEGTEMCLAYHSFVLSRFFIATTSSTFIFLFLTLFFHHPSFSLSPSHFPLLIHLPHLAKSAKPNHTFSLSNTFFSFLSFPSLSFWSGWFPLLLFFCPAQYIYPPSHEAN